MTTSSNTGSRFTLEKFLFLFIMIAVVVVGGRAHDGVRGSAPAVSVKGSSDGVLDGAFRPEPPLFVMASPEIKPVERQSSTDELNILVHSLVSEAEASAPQKASAPALPALQPGNDRLIASIGSVSGGDAPRTSVFRRVAADAPPAVPARAAAVVDLLSGEVYFEKNGSQRWPIASITKLMTALEAARTMSMKSVITLIKEDFPVEDDSILKHFVSGASFTVDDLIAGMMLVSSNEAAEALARHAGRDVFMEALNARASSLGMNDSRFMDPTGLSSGNQSTVRDLRILANELYAQNPEIFSLSRRPARTMLDAVTGKKLTLTNINKYAGEAGFAGGKTGYTEEARGNLLSVFLFEKRPVFIVVLGSEDRFGDTDALRTWFKNAFALH